MEAANPFLPEMVAFALPLHALREELVEIAARWAERHELYVAVERFFPTYEVVALALGAELAPAIAEQEPVRRLCLRRGPFFEGAIDERQHLVRNPQSLTIVLEPVSEDGLRATALTAKMGDEAQLAGWAELVRETARGLHRGAWAIDPGRGGRQHVPDHFHTQGAHDLAAAGLPMRSAAGSALFQFYDLT